MERAIAKAPHPPDRPMMEVIDFVTKEWIGLPSRTPKSIRPVAVNATFPFTVPPVADLCDGDTLSPRLLDQGVA